jgi:hypothetical protein
MQAIENTILNRIYGHGRDWCFTPSDFLSVGSAGAVRIALFRLKRKKTIRQLATGLYDYPRTHPELGMLSPDPEAVAKALARERNIRIQPSGAYAANLLGLSEHVPARIVFLTDGAPRKIRVGNQEIVLRRTTPRNMATAGRISGTIIQALRFIGKDRIIPGHKQSLMRKLTAAEKRQLLKDRLYAPGWMRPLLEEISGGGQLHA